MALEYTSSSIQDRVHCCPLKFHSIYNWNIFYELSRAWLATQLINSNKENSFEKIDSFYFSFDLKKISNSKKMIFQFQDSSASHIASATVGAANSSNNQGTFRRMIDAVRYCFTKRSRSKKPDWLLDKQTNRSRSKSIPSEDVSHGSSTANLLCSWLSVDPSLPSHYRVCNQIPFEVYVLSFFSHFSYSII